MDSIESIAQNPSIYNHIPPAYHGLAGQLFRLVQESGLSDPFEVAVAVYRWTEGRPEYDKIREGLECFFREVAGSADQ